MKSIGTLEADIKKWGNRVVDNLIVAQRETAKKICKDAKSNVGNGKYSDSIKVSNTESKNGIIRTKIYTDLLSNGYVIGRMIERGTGVYALEPHVGKTKTFIASGYRYWFVPTRSVERPIGKRIVINGNEFYIAYAQPPKPHFLPALNSNKLYYKQKIREALKK